MNFLKPFIKTSVETKKPQIGKFLVNTSGNVGMMFAIVSVVLVGGLAVAIDLSNAFSARQRLQNTTDAIALLAARDGIENRSELQVAAQAYFDELYPNESGARIEVLDISRDGDQVNVSTRNNIDTFFAPIFGHNDLNVSVKSSTIFSQQSLDVTLVLDTTGSMRGAKLAGLKTAATRLMDTFEDLNNDKLRVSIVPFAQYVNVGTDQRNERWLDRNGVRGNTVCVGSRIAPLNTQVEAIGGTIPAIPGVNCGEAIRPLTNDFRALKRTISNLEAQGLTYAPAGLMWGWRTLDSNAPFTEAASSGRGQKALVLMTDGANTRSVSGATHNGRNREGADETTAEICERVKDSDIVVYTIAYEVEEAGTRRLLQGCASNPTNFFNADNAADLDQAFGEISANLNELRISS